MFKNSAPLFLVAVHSILHFFKSSLHIVIQSVIYSVITFHESGTNKIPVPMGTWVKCSSGRKQWWNVTHLSTVLKYKFQVLFFLVLPILVFPLYAYLLILHDISEVHFFKNFLLHYSFSYLLLYRLQFSYLSSKTHVSNRMWCIAVD